jgi:DNA-binding transcriptional regulator YdaS (Cro superfamily)
MLASVKRVAYTERMKLSKYLSDHGSQTKLARAIGAQPQLIWQWSTGVRRVPVERCNPIEQATNGAVTRQDLRPDDWQSIWPELAQQPATEHITQGV